jgi:NAD(P)-dependent dehydrogenase (short-subunit alcohol dehydrogenase family)
MSVTISDSLAGRRALVTGGSKGAGAAIVSRLTEGGATVMTTARAMPPAAQRACTQRRQ